MSAAYGQALRAIYSRGGVPWGVHDEVVRIDPDVRHLVPHEAEGPLYQFLRLTIQPGDVVLDVGAFLGVYAVLAARWVGDGGRVVAFEPTPSSALIARRHVSWNEPEGQRIHFVEAAVSDRAGRAAFHQYDAHGMPYVNSLAAAVDTPASSTAREVRVVTIDDVCRELEITPTVVRMDVQGAEVHALRGARETICAATRLTLAVEMHPQCWGSFGVTGEEMRRTIEELGLTARPLMAGEPLFGRDAHAVLTKSGSQETR
jgi:FkbM family methyltransferase